MSRRDLRSRLFIGAFTGYFALGLVGFWMLSGLMHISLLLAWGVLELTV